MLSVDNGSRSSRLLALGVACFGLLAVGSGLASWIAVQAVLRLVWPHRWLVGSVVVITEAAFYAYFKARHRQLAVVGGVPKGVDPQRAFDRFLAMATALPGAFDREKYSSTWFLNTPYEQIKAGNVEEFICYGFWYRTRCVRGCAQQRQLYQRTVKIPAADCPVRHHCLFLTCWASEQCHAGSRWRRMVWATSHSSAASRWKQR
jgi:hypothetical protein